MKWFERLLGKRDLDYLILEAVAKKRGNNDFLLSFIEIGDGCDWTAEIGNPTDYVRLGEVDGEVFARGKSPRHAVESLIAKLDRPNAPP